MTVIRINGHSITFNQSVGGVPMFTTIEGLKLNPASIIEQFPDLKDKTIPEIKREAIKRFKEKIKTFTTEQQVQDYLQEDLRKHGLILKMIYKKGFRPTVIHNGSDSKHK